MRRLPILLAAAFAIGPPGLAVAQTIQPIAAAPPAAESRLRLDYMRWDAMPEEARRWEAPAFVRFAQTPERSAQTKGAPRSARLSYGLGDEAEIFMGVTKFRSAKAGEAVGATEAGRDWKDVQDRKRRAYSIGVTTRW
jgi:hypothetical protein